MTACDRLRDRMPDLAHGSDAWTAADRSHLSDCSDCAAEWRLVQIGARLDVGPELSLDRLAGVVTARLRTCEPAEPVVRGLPWRAGIVGLVAVAASVALFVGRPRDAAVLGSIGGPLEAVLVLPELQGLDDHQLESVLQSLGPTTADVTPGVLPHIEELTETELEQLLRSEGGE